MLNSRGGVSSRTPDNSWANIVPWIAANILLMAADPKASSRGAEYVALDQRWQMSVSESDLGQQQIQTYFRMQQSIFEIFWVLL
jgi:hypothetical protein